MRSNFKSVQLTPATPVIASGHSFLQTGPVVFNGALLNQDSMVLFLNVVEYFKLTRRQFIVFLKPLPTPATSNPEALFCLNKVIIIYFIAHEIYTYFILHLSTCGAEGQTCEEEACAQRWQTCYSEEINIYYS